MIPLQRKAPLLAWVALAAVLSAIAALALSRTLPVRDVVVNVRWHADVTDAERRALEARFHLDAPAAIANHTWRYALRDWSRANIQRLVESPRVDDTHAIDRRRFQPAAPPASAASRVLPWAIAIGGGGAAVLWLLRTLARRLGSDEPRRRVTLSPSLLAAITMAGPLLLSLATAVVLVMAAAGRNLLWDSTQTGTLIEALYARHPATVVKLLERGADPNEPLTYRGVEIAPLEAAVLSGRPGLVEMLVHHGAVIDESNRMRLYCLAIDISAFLMAESLADGLTGTPDPAQCEKVERPRL